MAALDITQDQSVDRPLALQDGIDDITDGGSMDLSDNAAILNIGSEDPDVAV